MHIEPSSVIALVLGGTSGLGRACAETLAASGASIIITGRTAIRAEGVASEIGPNVRGVGLDLTDSDSVHEFCSRLRGQRIGTLVLNSGGPPPESGLHVTSAGTRTALDYLLLAQIDIVNAVLPEMITAAHGRIVAIGSSGVQQPIPTLALSNIGRAALAAYLKTLASDVAGYGITVNMVLPGRIATDRVASLDARSAETTGQNVESVRSASEKRIPVGRYGTPTEFASAVAYLCSEGASFITGEQLRVDGGMINSY